MRSHCLGKPKKKELGAGHVGETKQTRRETNKKKVRQESIRAPGLTMTAILTRKILRVSKTYCCRPPAGFSDKEGMERYEVQLKSAVVADADKGSREKGTGNVAGTC